MYSIEKEGRAEKHGSPPKPEQSKTKTSRGGSVGRRSQPPHIITQSNELKKIFCFYCQAQQTTNISMASHIIREHWALAKINYATYNKGKRWQFSDEIFWVAKNHKK